MTSLQRQHYFGEVIVCRCNQQIRNEITAQLLLCSTYIQLGVKRIVWFDIDANISCLVCSKSKLTFHWSILHVGKQHDKCFDLNEKNTLKIGLPISKQACTSNVRYIGFLGSFLCTSTMASTELGVPGYFTTSSGLNN